MGLSVTVLGCSGSYAGPEPDSACSGYLVQSDETSVWMDCGSGTLANLQRHVRLEDLTAIVLSHAHPDHWVDTPIAHIALQHYHGRTHVPVYGTAETRQRIESARVHALDPAFDWTTITDRSTFEVGPLRFTCAVTEHPVETLAMRVDAAYRSLAYSADTGASWSMTTLGDDIDVALCEATMTDADADTYPHLSAHEAGSMCRDAGVERVVLTHLLPGADADVARDRAADAFGRDVELAHTHLTIEV